MRFVGIKYRACFYVIVARVFITQVISSFQILSLNVAISAPLYCALGMLQLHVFHSFQCHVMFFGEFVYFGDFCKLIAFLSSISISNS